MPLRSNKWLAVWLCLAAPVSFASSSADQLLMAMVKAGKELNYRGVFTYQAGNSMNTVKLIHAYRDGQEFERLFHQSGLLREVIRHGDANGCSATDGNRLLNMLEGLEGNPDLKNLYRLHIGEQQRVAGRTITQLMILPQDEYRYGYVVGVDNETGLMLQAVLINQQRQILELFQYVDIEIGVEIHHDELMPQQPNYRDANKDFDCQPEAEIATQSVHWEPTWLPEGFELTGIHQEQDAEHQLSMMYSDGIAMFSIFIDPANSAKIPSGGALQAHSGATSLVVNKIAHDDVEYAICVVGEIPESAARKIVMSVAAR